MTVPLHPLGLGVADTPEAAAAAVAEEVVRLIGRATVRDRDTGLPRPAQAGDIAILFRSRASHREMEDALDARGVPAYVYKGLGFFDADEIKDLVALLRFLAAPASDIRAAAFLRSRFVRLSDEALPRGVPALFREAAAPIDPAMRADDRARLIRARESVASWVSLSDRIPPAELLDRILSDTAYDYELRGPRRAQARENVKKMRTLIRRIQNRGYATLNRIAEHLDSLSAGDESNATLEAVNAVNLMTVHAAKGLEFPIVFVVNLAKGASGRQPPVRVVVRDPAGDPSISVASYISEADEDQAAREIEETKRLLYVALTRACDVLYLVTVLKDGEMRPGRGSLGEVLPDSVRALFSLPAAARREVEWRTPGGVSHTFRVVPPAETAAERRLSLVEDVPARLAFERLSLAGELPRIAVTRYLNEAAEVAGASQSPFAPVGDLIVGSLVHRLFQARVVTQDRAQLVRRAAALLRTEERAQLEDERGAVEEAADTFAALTQRPQVVSILSSGECEYEVPFSLRLDGGEAILRGTIDCLVCRADGSVHVLEFKTGRPRPEHQRQLEIYESAVRAMLPGVAVTGSVVYP